MPQPLYGTQGAKNEHAEKVKTLASNYAFEFATEFDPQKGKDESAGYHKSWTLFTAAIDEMQSEIDRLGQDAARYRWLRANPQWLGWDHDFRPDEVEREVDKAMAELQKEAQDQVATHMQPSFPPLPEEDGDYFLEGGKWIRCEDSVPF